MNKQQILDAIDAEIREMRTELTQVKSESKEASHVVICGVAYIEGLRFARDLVEKAEVKK